MEKIVIFEPGDKIENEGENWENWQKGPKLSIAEHQVEPLKFWLMRSKHFVFWKAPSLGIDLKKYGSVKFVEGESGYLLKHITSVPWL